MYRNGFICVVFILNFQLFTADVPLSLLYRNAGGGGLSNDSVKCTELLKAFAHSASNLTMCSIIYARPVRLCEKCVNEYVNFVLDFNEFLSAEDNGTTCKSLFISQDTLDAVLEFQTHIASVWDKGNCNNCFEWEGSIPTTSNNTKNFDKLHNETMVCIVDNVHKYGNKTDKVCENCMQLYVELDEFYKSLSTDGIGVDSVCMDVVDLMNTTRSVWSKDLDCCKLRRAPEIVFLCCSAIISALPVLFYLAMRYCGPIRDLPNVLKQSRFKQTFMRSSTGRIN